MSPYKPLQDEDALDIVSYPRPQPLSQLSRDERILEYLKDHGLDKKGTQIFILNSFNQTLDLNQTLSHQVEERHRLDEKPSKLVPGIFFGFWCICMLILIAGDN
jgi:hypothetical protein